MIMATSQETSAGFPLWMLLAWTGMTVSSWIFAYQEWRPGRSNRSNPVVKVLDAMGWGLTVAIGTTAFWICMIVLYVDSRFSTPWISTLRMPSLLLVVASCVLIFTMLFFRQPAFLIPPRFRGWWMWRSTPKAYEKLTELPIPPSPEDGELGEWVTDFRVLLSYAARYSGAAYDATERPGEYLGPSWDALKDRLGELSLSTVEDEAALEEWRAYAAVFNDFYQELSRARLPADMRGRRWPPEPSTKRLL